MTTKNTIIAVDLGTVNSVCAVFEHGETIIIPNSEGHRTTPSIVAFLDNNERKVGDSAKRQAVTNPHKTISFIKRFMGRTYDSVSKEISMVPYTIVNDNNIPKVKIDDRTYSAQEISAIILQKMKKSAEDYLGYTVTEAVITVPAYFNDAQRQATKEAGEIAGLNVKRIINEPTAACLSYFLDKKESTQKVVIYDFGGGTMDCSLIDIGDGVVEVLSTAGNSMLGGFDLDKKIVDWLAEEFKSENGVDLRKDPMAHQRLFESAEKAKIELSNSSSTDINLPYIMPVDGVPKHLVKTLSRAKFEQICDDLFKETFIPVKQVMEKAKLNNSDINEIILVGGSTRIPKIQEMIERFFGKVPLKGVNPDESVAAGASIQAAVLTGEIKDVLLLDVTPLSLGIETLGGVFTKLIEANTTIPTKKTEVFSTAADNQPGVELNVLQGERQLAKDNKSLGRFTLDGIPPAMRGIPQIEVEFNLDANGILNVSAKDKATGKSQHIKIEASSGLSDAEIKRMKEEASANADSDKKAKEEIDKLNSSDALIFHSEKQLKEFGDKLSQDKKDSILKGLEQLKEAHKEKSYSKIDLAITELNSAWQSASEEMYKAANTTSGQTPSTEDLDEKSEDTSVTDVEFEEIKEENK